jgi:hypothetical protein
LRRAGDVASLSLTPAIAEQLPGVTTVLPRQFDDATTDTIRRIEVMWLYRNRIDAAFEVEHTGAIYSGILRLARADTAGATHAFLGYLRQAQVGFSVGYPITEVVKTAIRTLPEDAWVPATRQDGDPRAGVHVAEITGPAIRSSRSSTAPPSQ